MMLLPEMNRGVRGREGEKEEGGRGRKGKEREGERGREGEREGETSRRSSSQAFCLAHALTSCPSGQTFPGSPQKHTALVTT
jgi:hypothetical protein